MASRNLCLLSVMLICKICTALHKMDVAGLRQKMKDFLPGAGVGQTEPGVALFHQYQDCHIHAFSSLGHIADTLVGDEHIGNLSLQFMAFGQRFLVDLHLTQDLFSHKYTRKLHQHVKDDINKILHRREHCYYQGHIRDNPKSHAALSACDGFRGYISDGEETYHIHPINGTSLHRVFRNSDRKKLHLRCGTDVHDVYQPPADIFQQHARKKRSIQTPYDSNQYTRYVELYLVNDYRTFDRHGKNSTVVFKRSQDIANIVNSLYRQLNIYIVLVGVEVWGTGDKISITSSADTTMENFLRYRKERINPYYPNDNAQLITGIFFDHGVVGKAIKGPICTHQFSGGVSMDYDGLVTLVATTVAHEMGHNFGMEHDNDTKCSCPEDKCIMAATSGQISPHHWSSCSQNALHEAFELGMDYCLRNPPKLIFEGPVCGNGFVEDGEECDCGLPKDCNNRCCNATTCQLHPQAQCGTGRCCNLDTCKPKAPSTLCREPIGECDLPEFCDGTNEFCPPDVYVKTGASCGGGQSYCYKGKCNTHNAQCQLLWGSTGRVSDPICFQQLNVRGDHDGNCGYNWTTDKYYACDRENVMCGLLHCVHLNEKLMFWRDNLALDMRANFLMRGNTQYVCRSTMLDVGLDMPDPGLVPDGAKCEDSKICINQACVPLMKLNIPECDDCHGNGVCNSEGHCHCDVGYAPPLCDRPGYGGSIDSGPATNEYAKRGLLIGLLVLFLVILPLMALSVLAYINRRRLIAWWAKGPRIKFGSLKKSQCQAPWPPQPRPSASFTEKRRSAAPNKPTTNLEISGPLMEDERTAEQMGPPKPLLPSRPIFTPPVPNVAAQPSPQPPKFNPPAASRQNQAPSSVSQVPAVAITGRDRKSFVGANVISNPQPVLDKRPVSISVSAPAADSSHPSRPFLAGNTGDKEQRPTISPPLSPSKGGKKITQSQSVREGGDKSSLQPGEKVIKRESFRGAEISNPILVSTTNRDSQVFADFEFDETGTLTRPIAASHSVYDANHSAETARDGCRSPVRRSQSDRPLSPKRRVVTDGQGSLGRKAAQNKPFRPRPLPPEPVPESEPLYINENLSDLTDLKACISSAFDGINLSLPGENNGTSDTKPAQPSRPAVSSVTGSVADKAGRNPTSPSNPSPLAPPKPTQSNNLNKEPSSAASDKVGGAPVRGSTISSSKEPNTTSSLWNKGTTCVPTKAPLSSSSSGASADSTRGASAASTSVSAAVSALNKAPSSSTFNKPASSAGQPNKGPTASTDKPSSSSVLNKGPTIGPSKGSTAGLSKGPVLGADKPVSSVSSLANKGPTTGPSKGPTTSAAARGPVANALNKALAASLENKGLANSAENKGPASSAAGKGPTTGAASKPAYSAQNKGPTTAGVTRASSSAGSNKAPSAGAANKSSTVTNSSTNKGPGAAGNTPSTAAGRGSSNQLHRSGSGVARPTVAPKPQPNKSVRSYNF